MNVEKAIIIVGAGRSGSTVFYNVFAEHPNVAWLSELSNRFPGKISKSAKHMKMIDVPVIGIYLRKKYPPQECYPFWEYYCRGFSQPCRDLTAGDVSIKVKENVRRVISNLLTSKRNRCLVKLTGWPRIGYMRELFNDAKFIHIVRDGRSVVNSLLQVNWWWGWQGPQNWRWGELTPEQKAQWEKYERSFVALAAIEWNILMDAMQKAAAELNKDTFMEIKYEDLCDAPVETYKKVLDFSELEWTPTFEQKVKTHTFKNTNYKWQQDLTSEQQRIVQEVTAENLKYYEYG